MAVAALAARAGGAGRRGPGQEERDEKDKESGLLAHDDPFPRTVSRVFSSPGTLSSSRLDSESG
jgi:hypothetical protein